ncbi:MAG: 4-(cytidine 5'-diphospho)-2-C-methyl-D-erythritol kinase [Bacteroidales bacterium]|nr:4-(cytidine 5'-diphospho)-2-C-methyl-D-erythritol kinase [Bacteroidales bacterium]
MTTYPICKINIGLHVVSRREDGYHDIETAFLPVDSLHDTLEITPLDGNADASAITLDGIVLDSAPADNLCLRAYRLMADEFHLPPVAIRLTKGIPFGAGLGGGSSDAAFTLKMLNTMFALGLDDSALERRAARLGADCAFFIKCRPAYATGIGDRLEPIDLPLGNLRTEIAMPEGEHVSTREAYAGIHLRPANSRPPLRKLLANPLGQWRDTIANDFEDSVFPGHPAIAALKEQMYRRGAVYASMSGSGAAVYGLFPTD